jgi:cell division protein ZapA
MAQVTLRINGYGYTIGCQDGEEVHLQAMAAEVDRRIESVKTSAGPSGEARMLVIAALLMADELFEAGHKLAAAEAAAAAAGTAGAGDTEPAPAADPKLGRRLGKLAKRAEDIAERLEHP